MSQVNLEIFKAALSLSVGVVTLGLGWFVGNRLSLKWNLIQKRREIDMANVQQFYSLYGEFKEVVKIWRVIKRNKDSALAIPSDSRWSLLARACAVEGKNEAILVKIATERDLEEKALVQLGLFRQAIQKLRESIRDDTEVGAIIISAFNEDPTSDGATNRLRRVAGVRQRDFDAKLTSFKASRVEKE